MLTGNGRPPFSSAAWASSLVMADAIQVTSRWVARPISAVTSPPVPRRISPSGPNVTGPRLDTSTSGGPEEDIALHSLQLLEQLEPVTQQARHQELPADRFLARPPQPLAQARIAQDLQTPRRALLDARDQETGFAIGHLQGYSAHRAADQGPALPDRLGHRQTEPLTRGLLDHHIAMGLERVDLDRADIVQVVQYVDVRV